MPIEPPQLDDLRYSRLVEELVRRIPVYAPEWTNHNDSDPGITLLQLFAYLGEQVGYRLNRVPEKAHVALLALLGIRLSPARAATSQVAFFLSNPRNHPAMTLEIGSELTRRDEATVTYETDLDLDIVPAEVVAWISTKNPFIWDLLRLDDAGAREPVPTQAELPPKIPADDSDWMTLAWSGKKPMAKELPLTPVSLLPASDSGVFHPWLWLGLSFNEQYDAGFLGVEVTLHVVLDDDEAPTSSADITCEPIVAPGELAPPPITWLSYIDSETETIRTIPGRIIDTTDQLAHSGTIRFTVPFSMSSPKEWADLREKVTPTDADNCMDLMTSALKSNLSNMGTVDVTGFQSALASAVTAAEASVVTPEPEVTHPLDPKLQNPATVNGWLRIGPLPEDRSLHRVRHLGFNVVGVTHAESVFNQVLGNADGRPGQVFRLPHQNILVHTLELEIAESAEPDALLQPWTEVLSLDMAGPFDKVYELDAEAGIVRFGDGNRGAIPPLVPRAGQVVAKQYRHGGGLIGECTAGAINKLAVQATGLAAAINVVPARGGADAETLDQAKERARKELSTRSRAVTSDDFSWIAKQTPTVRVARAIVVPRRRPLPMVCPPSAQPVVPPLPDPVDECVGTSHEGSAKAGALALPLDCGPKLPIVAGLDDTFEAPGMVSVVVVPDLEGFEPLPTPSFLRAVCCWLDRHRLVTTEVHVVPPQYFRLCNLYVRVRGKPGYTRLQLQELVLDHLSTWLDVLKGGLNGEGAPFGGQVHVADLIAEVFRAEGVDGVEEFTASFVRTRSNANPRSGKLVRCPTAAGEFDRVELGPEETTSLETSTFTLATA